LKGLMTATWTEYLKMRRSKIFLITLLVFAFIAVMLGLLIYIARHPEIAGRSATVAAKVSVLGNGDWSSFFNLLVQVVLALGPLGFAMVASWVFGREYADRVIKDLLALPVSRFTIVAAKFIIVAAWSILLALILFVISLLTGLVTGTPGWSAVNAMHTLGTFSGSALLTLLLCTPVAFIACASRGYLLPVAFAILTLIVTNFIAIGLPNLLPYFPWGIPALYSGISGSEALPPAGIISYLILILTSLAGFVGTVAWWRYADQK
jgi:ABC-2 type transport system permease protein